MVSLKVGRRKRFFQMFFQKFFLSPYISMFQWTLWWTFVVFTWTPSTRPYSSRSSRQAKRWSFSLSSFLFLAGDVWGGGGRGKRGEEVGSIAKTSSLKCFQTAPANMRSVTSQLVVFTYSHFNWPVDHLNYFITVSNFVFDHANPTR